MSTPTESNASKLKKSIPDVVDPMTTPLLRWSNFSSWAPMIDNWLPQYSVDKYLERLKEYLPKPDYIDDLIWVDEVLQSVLEVDFEFVQEQLSKVLKQFDVHAFHGCRTKDASSFLRV